MNKVDVGRMEQKANMELRPNSKIPRKFPNINLIFVPCNLIFVIFTILLRFYRNFKAKQTKHTLICILVFDLDIFLTCKALVTFPIL